jgi:hypothetical protein
MDNEPKFLCKWIVSGVQEINTLEFFWFPTVISFDLPLVLVIGPTRSKSDFVRLWLGESKSRVDGPPLRFISIASSMMRFVRLLGEKCWG